MKKKISCHIITYNQKDYIEECIEGVLMQKVNFSMEIIIGDDNSTDGTREILKDYAKKYPDLIKLNLREVRGSGIPGKDNFVSTLEMCKGEYVSLCDGDDYWTDPLKLQKQVDFLEKNKEFVISCSNGHIVNFDSSFVKLFNENKIPEITDVNYILSNKWYMPTASVVFRNENFELPKWFIKVQNGDYALYLVLSANGGLVHYKNEISCNYRLHSEGFSNIFKKENVYSYSMLFINKMFNDYSKGKYYSLIKINIESHSISILKSLPITSKRFWKVSIDLFWFNKALSRKYFLFLKKRIFVKIKSLLK